MRARRLRAGIAVAAAVTLVLAGCAESDRDDDGSSSSSDKSWTDAFSRADAALYEAKEAGKDRIVFGRSAAKGSTGRFRAMGIPPPK